MTPEAARSFIYGVGLGLLAAIPAILRGMLGVKTLEYVGYCLCPFLSRVGAPRRDIEERLVANPERQRVPLASAIRFETQSWEEVRAALSWSQTDMVMAASLRLVLMHLSQPVLYGVFFYAGYDIIDPVQRVLGWCVLVREAAYTLVCFIGLYKNKSYLFFDAGAKILSGPFWIEGVMGVMFIVMADKIVAFNLRVDDSGWFFRRYCIFSTLLDMCAVAALVIGGMHGTLYAPLAVGYGITALAGVVSCFFWVGIRGIILYLRVLGSY